MYVYFNWFSGTIFVKKFDTSFTPVWAPIWPLNVYFS